MKKLILFLLVFSSNFINGQCNTDSIAPYHVYLSNTISYETYTTGAIYVCPNAIVYDTLYAFTCQYALVCSGGTLVVSGLPGCNMPDRYFLKSGATLLGNFYGATIFMENGANIGSTPVYSTTCTNLVFPPMNCTATGIKSYESELSQIKIFPNPSTNNFVIENPNQLKISGQLLDYLGKEEMQINELETRHQVNIEHLPKGIYFLKINSEYNSKFLKVIKE